MADKKKSDRQQTKREKTAPGDGASDGRKKLKRKIFEKESQPARHGHLLRRGRQGLYRLSGEVIMLLVLFSKDSLTH